MRTSTCATALILLVTACSHADSDPAQHTNSAPPDAPTTVRPPNSKLPPEERLHYISVPQISGIVEGSRVDFLGTFSIAREGAQAGPYHMVTTLLQNVAVVDVREPSEGRIEAGFGLTIDELELLLVASEKGTITPLMRSAGDVVVHAVTKKTLREKLEDLEVLQEKRQIRLRTAPKTAAAIGEGLRGIVLPNSLPPGVATPTGRVDIHGTFADVNGDVVTIALMQRVGIVDATDDELLLSVTLAEAEALALASAHGKLNFAPRRDEDEEISTITKKTLREVLEDLEVIQEKRQIRIRKKPRKKKMRSEKTIEIIAGDRRNAPARAVARPAEPQYTERYENPGQNDWVETSQDKLSTFAADVDGGSYTIARRKFTDGMLPPADSVRPEEWVNYFNYDYPKPEPNEGPFAVSLEAAPSPFQTDASYRLLRIGVQGKTFQSKPRPPVHLTFLVDVSGSMSTPDKLGLAADSLKHLVNSLQPDDTVALTTYAGRTQTLLEHTSVANRGRILRAIAELQTGGGTAMNDGLAAAYALAGAAFTRGHENRVIVLSDGDANIGGTGVDDMLATIAKGAKRGITMSTIGFGMGNYQDASMEQLANKGNGNYYYIDSMDEARRVFGDQLDATLQTIARDVKLQVEFDAAAVSRYRLIGYENRDIADKDFRNDDVDAGEIGAGHSVTALYEIQLADPNAETVATVRIRHKDPVQNGPAKEQAVAFEAADIADNLGDTSSSFRFAAAVAAFAEIARKSPHAAHLNLDWVEEVASRAVDRKKDRRELLRLVRKARSLGL